MERTAGGSRRGLLLGLIVALVLSWAVGLYLILSDDDSPSSAEEGASGVLYVQKGKSGTLEPLAGREDAYRLTIDGVDPKAAFFADRPERFAGAIDNEALIDGAFADWADPPNAALAMDLGAQDRQVILPVELSKPRLDPGASRVSYLATRLQAPSEALAYFAYSEPAEVPRRFDGVDLFIDSGTYYDVCQTTLHTGDEPLFFKKAVPALGSPHYEQVEGSINPYSEGRISLEYNAEKGFFEDEGGFHADFYYEYPDGTEVHVHPHCNINGIYLRDTECTITSPDGSTRECRHESGPDGSGGRLIDYFVY